MREGEPIVVRSVKADEWAAVKAVRLAALADAPYAFTETLADARRMPDETWRARTEENAAADVSTCALAIAGETAVGMAVGVLDANGPPTAHLFAMWVAPPHRGGGAAAALVACIAGWARDRGALVLGGHVTEHNPRAITFYQKIGFRILDERRPWPPDPTRAEIAMRMDL